MLTVFRGCIEMHGFHIHREKGRWDFWSSITLEIRCEYAGSDGRFAIWHWPYWASVDCYKTRQGLVAMSFENVPSSMTGFWSHVLLDLSLHTV